MTQAPPGGSPDLLHPNRRSLVIGLAALPWAAGASKPGKLRLVATEFPPYTSASLEGGGIAAQVTRAALQRLGWDMELSFRPWVRALAELQQASWDGVVGLWHNQERERYLSYTRPLGISNRIGFMARAGSVIQVHDLSRLQGLTIGTVRDYVNPPVFERARLRRDEAVDDLGNLRKLLAGRVDLALVDKGVAMHLLQTQLRDAAAALVWLEPALAELPLHTALVRQHPLHSQRVADLNRSLQELHSSGAMAQLLQRHARLL
ncbi:MAG: substrate-binding periplasmic protein [Roseateles sp.]